ncbi:MAG: type II secretion system inner membrane protein GspF [Pseudomonadota bacterium]
MTTSSMPVYEYSAYTSRGKKKSGIIDADSLMSAGLKLQKMSCYPLTLKELQSETFHGSGQLGSFFSRYASFHRISAEELSILTRQLSTLMSAGFPLVSAVSTLASQSRTTAIKKVLSTVKDSIEQGKSFAESLSMYPSVFSSIFINMVAAGESSGTLEIVLERLADITEKSQATRKKIQVALAYPMVMALVGTLILFFLLTHVVPGIVGIYTDMQQTLPRPTLFLISLSTISRKFWWIMLLAVFGAAGGVYTLTLTEKGRLWIDRLVLGLPGIGDLIRKMAIARFSRVLGSLLQNGVPMLTALGIARTITGNAVLEKAVIAASERVEQGSDLGQALEEHRVFPELAIQMIRVGEKSGELETLLDKTAQLYDREVESTVATVTSLLEPAIILVMAVIVGFIVLSVCLPILEMNQLVR